jgi:hypothetical protein
MGKYRLVLLISILIVIKGYSQDIKMLEVLQTGDRISVSLDILGSGKVESINLYYSVDGGVNWIGPLKYVNNIEAINKSLPLYNVQLTWDALSEVGSIEGDLIFKVNVEVGRNRIIETPYQTSSSKINRHKTRKNIWLVTTIASAGAGVYLMTSSNSMYNEYQNSTNETEGLRNKIKSYDMLYPIAFGIAGLASVNFIIQASKTSKAKRVIRMQPALVDGGGGVVLTYNF